jgi:hypothetical protein
MSQHVWKIVKLAKLFGFRIFKEGFNQIFFVTPTLMTMNPLFFCNCSCVFLYHGSKWLLCEGNDNPLPLGWAFASL